MAWESKIDQIYSGSMSLTQINNFVFALWDLSSVVFCSHNKLGNYKGICYSGKQSVLLVNTE